MNLGSVYAGGREKNHKQELPAASDSGENWVTHHGLEALGSK